MRNFLLSAVSAALVLSNTVSVGAQTQTLKFQEGFNGFESVQDSYLQTGSPDQNNNFLNHNENKIWEIEWDGSDAGGRNLAMFWFQNIFGDGPNQIPLGSTIHSAVFESMIINDGSRTDVDLVYRLTKEWDETDVTFNSYFSDLDAAAFGSAAGNQADDVGQALLEQSAFISTDTVLTELHIPQWSGGAYDLDLTAIAQEWSNGSPNFGFVLMVVQGGNGFGHISSEAGQISRSFIEELIAQGVDVDGDIADDAFAGFDVNISPTLVVNAADGTEYIFQQGLNGYESYQDATVSAQGLGTEPDGGVSHLWNHPLGGEGVIRANISADGLNEFGLVRFDDIIGTGAGQIPPNTQISSAIIRFFVADDDSNEVLVNQILPFTGVSADDESIVVNTDWDEDTVTYANFVQDGFAPVFGQELTDNSPVGTFIASSEFRLAEADVTISIQDYSNGAPNLGWTFEGNDVHFVGKEAAAVFGGPALVVEFTPPGGTAVEDYSIY